MIQQTLTLRDCHLFAIASPADLARRLGTSLAELERLAGHETSYKVWTNAGGREVEEPVPALQALHQKVHKYLARVMTPDYLHSPVRGRSYVSNARVHVGPTGLIKIDIKKFFGSVPRAGVYRFFKEVMCCAGDASGLLAKLVTYRGHLPTGSSSSQILAYYVFGAMFDEIARIARARHLRATCYVDDITLSGQTATSGALHEVRNVIASYGLKSHKAKVVRPSRAKLVTGVIVTATGLRLPNQRHLAIAQGFSNLDAAASPVERLQKLTVLISRLHEAGTIEPIYKSRARTLELQRRAARMAMLELQHG